MTFTYALTAEEFVDGHMTALRDTPTGRLLSSWLALRAGRSPTAAST